METGQAESTTPLAIRQLGEMLLSEETLDTTLQRVVMLARESIDGCDAAGVTLIERGKPSTAAATDDWTLEIDAAQYDAGEGPCLQTSTSGQFCVAPDVAHEERWLDFCERAFALGLRSALALPLTIEDTPFGSLNLYSKDLDAFAPAGIELGV